MDGESLERLRAAVKVCVNHPPQMAALRAGFDWLLVDTDDKKRRSLRVCDLRVILDEVERSQAEIPEAEIERAYWAMKAKQDRTQTDLPMSERDAFKWAVREMLLRHRQ